MGRSAYTPRTLAHMAQQASSSSASSSRYSGTGSATSVSEEDNDEEVKPTQQEMEQSEYLETSYEIAARHPNVVRGTALGEGEKDQPVSWSQQSFDPDGEDLPVVHEAFIDPTVPISAYRNEPWFQAYRVENGGDEEESDPDDEDQGDDYDGEGDEDHEIDMDEEEDSEEMIQHFQNLQRQQLMMMDDEEEVEEDEDVDEVEECDNGDEPLHGNQGYYDHPTDYTSHSNTHSPSPSSTGTARPPPAYRGRRSGIPLSVANANVNNGEMSPSAPVFHNHTLPFTLPAPGEIQMQRRSSGGSTGSQNGGFLGGAREEVITI